MWYLLDHVDVSCTDDDRLWAVHTYVVCWVWRLPAVWWYHTAAWQCSEQGGRGEVSGHCIPQIIVTFVSTPAPAPAPAAAAAHSWNQRAEEDGEVATILVILNTHLYSPVLLCTLLDRIMNHNWYFWSWFNNVTFKSMESLPSMTILHLWEGSTDW